jgi:ribosome-associated protein
MENAQIITPQGRIVPAGALTIETRRSGGPGGQHANTSDTAVRVTIEVAALGLTTEEISRVDRDRITASSSTQRSQLRNREEALRRALERLDEALAVPTPRRRTRPTAASRERRLHEKQRRAEKKAGRSERFD